MGADGGVTCYDLDEVLRIYAEKFSEFDFWKDMTYASAEPAGCAQVPRMVLTLPSGQRILMDYADTENREPTLSNSWAFNSAEGYVDIPDDLRWRYNFDSVYYDGEYHKGKMPVSQMRVLTVLAECWKQEVEVWT